MEPNLSSLLEHICIGHVDLHHFKKNVKPTNCHRHPKFGVKQTMPNICEACKLQKKMTWIYHGCEFRGVNV
jgi:hypothetical protein